LDELILETGLRNATIHLREFYRRGLPGREPDQEPFRSIIREIRKRNRVIFNRHPDSNQRQEVLEYISKQDIHLLALPKSQLHSIGHHSHRLSFEKTYQDAKIPVLILKEGEYR
jgi:hypothetical protein